MVAEVQPAVVRPPAFHVGGVVPKLGLDGRQLWAAGAVRVSSDKQGEGHSPETQQEAILARARADGYMIDKKDIYEDRARGHKLTRKGYVAILRGVREGRYAAVYVYMLDRWGRDSIERQQRGKEFDKLGVPLISVLEGQDEPGLVRVIRAELAEEESRKNAQRVTPNRLKAATEGVHCGMTPYGYTRVYPEYTSGGRKPAGMLVPHEPRDGTVRQADVVREMFSRYASGAWSTRELAEDLNRRGIRGAKGKPWSTATVGGVLRNPVYCGDVRFNRRPSGHYLRAAEGSMFVAEGKHEALVARPVFEAVQRRLTDGSTFQRRRVDKDTGEIRTHQTIRRRTRHTPLVAGLLRCVGCGEIMVANVTAEGSARHSQVRCANRHKGRGCTGSAYRLDLATDALLAEVSRLRDAPWTMQGEQILAGDQGATAAALDRELAAAREKMARATRRFMVEIDEPTAEDRAAFEIVRAEMGARIRALEQQQAALKHDAQALPRLRALHARLHQTEVADLVRRLRAASADADLRDLLTSLVESARLVERVPETRSTWLRLKVTWQPDVQRLLDVGLLALDPAPTPPALREQTSSDTHRGGVLDAPVGR